ncbi:MAG: response regulator transcription factor [Bdellovibrionaceae bacterium]|nr:response regulator transcription factor [Pseudobdellovibrionaceae bacterium]MDW8190363.1 response regulator transcription factor [Pseudobdellovibrionaceae bacterium]
MKVVICEDEERLLQHLVDSLKTEPFALIQVQDRQALLDTLALEKDVSLVVMDRLLGPCDMADDVPWLRQKYPLLKILILSVIDSPEEKALVINRGAHDYLSKPFSLVELQARIRALLRDRDALSATSAMVRGTDVYRFGNVTLDPISHRVFIDGKSVHLSHKEFSLLYYLLKNPGRVYSRFQLLDLVWSQNLDIESNVVESTIKNLRKKLSSSKATICIESQRGVGYWIAQ